MRIARVAFSAFIALLLANCGAVDKFGARVDPRYGTASSPRIVDEDDRAPRGGGVYRIGRPYQVAGRTYTPEHNPTYSNEGLASWYGGGFHGRRTANGETFDMYSISAAHPTLPLPSYARVTNLANHRSIIVRINDRGPYAGNRVIDLSSKTADLLGYKGHGLTRVRVEYVGPAPLEGSDDRGLLATLRTGSPAPAPSSVMVASATPFLPQVQSPLPQARDGVIPLPPDRPFDVGQGVPAGESAPRIATVPAIKPPRREPVMATAGSFGTTPRLPAAFAEPTGSFSGRGLY
jgi:peptidoglycan lytic transglycosylase